MLCSLPLLIVSIAAFEPASVTTPVSGVFTLTYVSPSVPKGTNGSGQSIFVSTAKGANKNTGASNYLAGASVVNVDTAAMVQGNGTHSGRATFTDGTSTVVKRFSGITTTKMVGGRPESTFQGTWKILSGTGRYAGATGNGTYKGRFETGSRYAVEWKGSTSM